MAYTYTRGLSLSTTRFLVELLSSTIHIVDVAKAAHRASVIVWLLPDVFDCRSNVEHDTAKKTQSWLFPQLAPRLGKAGCTAGCTLKGEQSSRATHAMR